MKIYVGTRDRNVDNKQWVTVNGETLDLRLDLYDHSPSGFEWGYEGSGPAQTALAILADALGDGDRALTLYQDFKSEVIAKFPHTGDLALTEQEVLDWVQQAEHP